MEGALASPPTMLHSWKSVALLRQLIFIMVAGIVLYVGMLVMAALGPAIFTGGVVGPAVLYIVLIGLSFLLMRSYQALARQSAITETAVEVGEYRQTVGELRGENRMLDLKARMARRLGEVVATRQAAVADAKLEHEVGKREKKIQKLLHEGKVSEIRQQSTLAAAQRELEYYKREHNRLHQENLWLKGALRQNHVDLAFLKEHVTRFLSQSRASLISRVRTLFSLSSPSPAIVRLTRALDSRQITGDPT